uniref:Rubredoxin_C domain-containing protein n=1 Tax=Parastrongyloides trichosuri TaxID=131310 RepID=A0A0N4Z5F7_PARTI
MNLAVALGAAPDHAFRPQGVFAQFVDGGVIVVVDLVGQRQVGRIEDARLAAHEVQEARGLFDAQPGKSGRGAPGCSRPCLPTTGRVRAVHGRRGGRRGRPGRAAGYAEDDRSGRGPAPVGWAGRPGQARADGRDRAGREGGSLGTQLLEHEGDRSGRGPARAGWTGRPGPARADGWDRAGREGGSLGTQLLEHESRRGRAQGAELPGGGYGGRRRRTEKGGIAVPLEEGGRRG